MHSPRRKSVCVHCGSSTRPGSGRHKGRLPAEVDGPDGLIIGYACRACRHEECERCGDYVAESVIVEGEALCLPCSELGQRRPHKHSAAIVIRNRLV